jgi:hypothetical protein
MKIRESKGFAYESRRKFYARVTIAPQSRQEVALPWCAALDAARERAHVLQSLVNRLREAGEESWIEKVLEVGACADEAKLAELGTAVAGIVEGKVVKVDKPKDGPTTFRTFAERWTSGELHALYPDHIDEKASVADDVERLAKHILPHVKDVPMRAFTREHADLVMAKLSPTLKPGTRRQVAQLVNRVVRLAQFVGIIDRSPLPPGWLPKAPKADSIAKESLLPSEEAKLLGETTVPLAFRVLYAFLHREGMRKGEAKALEWAGVRLANGVVSLDENKTDMPRSWVMQQSVRRMLEAWHVMQGEPKAGRVFAAIPDAAWEKLAPIYRSHCQAAGIDRARLFERKANKLQLRAHDMRAFFVTAAMYGGHDAMWITDRTGHTSLGMLRRYERDVRRWRELGETPVDADLAIPETRHIRVGKRVGRSPGGPTGDPPKCSEVHGKGLEPIRLAAAEPKSAASASFATRAVHPAQPLRPHLSTSLSPSWPPRRRRNPPVSVVSGWAFRARRASSEQPTWSTRQFSAPPSRSASITRTFLFSGRSTRARFATTTPPATADASSWSPIASAHSTASSGPFPSKGRF